MRVALIGAELEENLGLRYMASALERENHQVEIIPFNYEHDIPETVGRVLTNNPQIVGLSMVFTSRAQEFCKLARMLRLEGYKGHIVAGGHFASLNCERLLRDFPEFDSVALCEGEEIICLMAGCLDRLEEVAGLCYRKGDNSIAINPSNGNPNDLDALSFPKRGGFHEYFDKPIASIVTSRGCWRDCAFCSINAWYKQGGGKKFRIRSIENIVAEMKELYFDYGVRIFNFQDDNFFLPNPKKATQRFQTLKSMLHDAGIEDIAIAVKARPDSITEESISVLDELGLFRVFLGVENASEHGLRNLNRLCTLEHILNALRILNDFDIHIAYNLLMFEPDTIMDDILINLRFMERHMDNPFNFCRAEAYAGTGLEQKLRAEDRLLGSYFGFDYRLKDPRSEAFHKIANYAFFDRNFSDFGLHYFNMQVDFYYQLLRRFHPELLSQSLRGAVRSFIKETNLDTYQCLCQIYDFVVSCDPRDQVAIRGFAQTMRHEVDARSKSLYRKGKRILDWIDDIYERQNENNVLQDPMTNVDTGLSLLSIRTMPYRGIESVKELEFAADFDQTEENTLFDVLDTPIPYSVFRSRLDRQKEIA